MSDFDFPAKKEVTYPEVVLMIGTGFGSNATLRTYVEGLVSKGVMIDKGGVMDKGVRMHIQMKEDSDSELFHIENYTVDQLNKLLIARGVSVDS